MENLTFQDSLPLIKAMRNGVLNEGLWESLKAYGQADSQKPNKASESIFCIYTAGADFQESISKCKPSLPQSISQILIAGYRNSMLDFALEDIEKTISETDDSVVLNEKLTGLIEKYEKCIVSGICSGCLEREFHLLLAQAQKLNATTVELTQNGDSFLEQNFIGSSSIHLKRPTHSLVYRTLQHKLEDLSYRDEILKIGDIEYEIKKKSLAAYLIFKGNQEVLHVKFLGVNITEPTYEPDACKGMG
ncbi:hypothetical protein CSA37_01410 [Candidatus Fermentibacteria bacterium]|nr:MAG: hypothetical protein CSA37_01410 [Candidatus Fermentibacteria bacterium]